MLEFDDSATLAFIEERAQKEAVTRAAAQGAAKDLVETIFAGFAAEMTEKSNLLAEILRLRHLEGYDEEETAMALEPSYGKMSIAEITVLEKQALADARKLVKSE